MEVVTSSDESSGKPVFVTVKANGMLTIFGPSGVAEGEVVGFDDFEDLVFDDFPDFDDVEVSSVVELDSSISSPSAFRTFWFPRKPKKPLTSSNAPFFFSASQLTSPLTT